MNEPEISKEECASAIEARPAPRVTKEDMDARIKDVSYSWPFGTVTLCNIALDNGYSVRGESACVDMRNFDVNIGKRLAYDQAVNKLWPLFGFLLAEDTYRKDNPVPQWKTLQPAA